MPVQRRCFEPAYAGGLPQAASLVHSMEALSPQTNIRIPYFECWLKTYQHLFAHCRASILYSAIANIIAPIFENINKNFRPIIRFFSKQTRINNLFWTIDI